MLSIFPSRSASVPHLSSPLYALIEKRNEKKRPGETIEREDLAVEVLSREEERS